VCNLPEITSKHKHPLVESTKDTQWFCDGCSGDGAELLGTRNSCDQGCDFDYCDGCVEKTNEPVGESLKIPRMVLYDSCGSYCEPGKTFGDVTRGNILKFIEDYETGELTESQCNFEEE
jgi:hypothetical protein